MQLLIIIFTVASYLSGARAIIKNQYRPNIYSRIIWQFVALNGLMSVILLKNSASVILYAILGFFGSALILALSLGKSKPKFGFIELFSTILLFVSLGIWFFTKAPLLNLTIGLIITFVGGIPTFIKAIKDPYDEDLLFWLFFAVGSLITIFDSDRSTIVGYLYPLYFLISNTVMTLLCARRYVLIGSSKKSSHQ